MTLLFEVETCFVSRTGPEFKIVSLLASSVVRITSMHPAHLDGGVFLSMSLLMWINPGLVVYKSADLEDFIENILSLGFMSTECLKL